MPTSKAEPSVKIRVLVVDDHPLFRDGVAALINRQSDMKCCGEAHNAPTALAKVSAENPDLVLLDLRLGANDGIELIKSLKAQREALRILVLSQCDENVYAERSLRAGAAGYVMKEQATDALLDAIRKVLHGDIHASQAVTSALMRTMLQTKPAGGSGVANLTDRELHVFSLLGNGMSTREIASKLNVSFKTVESHRENIKHKLGLQNAGELTNAAREWVREQNFPGAPSQSSASKAKFPHSSFRL